MARKESVETSIEEALKAKGKVRELRDKCDIKQTKLADDIGVSQQTVSRIEGDKLKMSVDTLIRLSKYFEVTTDYLLGISNVRHAPDSIVRDFKNSDELYALIQICKELNERDRKLLYHLAKNMRDLN